MPSTQLVSVIKAVVLPQLSEHEFVGETFKAGLQTYADRAQAGQTGTELFEVQENTCSCTRE